MSDVVAYQGRSFWVNGTDLAIFYHILILEINSLPEISEWLAVLRDELDFMAHNDVGTRSLFLDDSLDGQDKLHDFIRLCEAGRARLGTWGDPIPNRVLENWNIHGNAPPIWTGNTPVKYLRHVPDAFLRLLRGEENPATLGPHEPVILLD